VTQAFWPVAVGLWPAKLHEKVWGPSLLVERASGPQRRLPSRRLEFLHFGTDFLTVPPRIDQAEAHALYQGMASAVPLEAVNSGL
jgi:hypothetical protein